MKLFILFIAFFSMIEIPHQMLANGKSDSASGYIIEHESNLAESRTGPHAGRGTSTAYVFLQKCRRDAVVISKTCTSSWCNRRKTLTIQRRGVLYCQMELVQFLSMMYGFLLNREMQF